MAKVSPLVIIPPVVFAAIAGLFAAGMWTRDATQLPSAYIGRPAPGLVGVPPLTGMAPLTAEDFTTGEVTIVNFWASWCPPCRAEHPALLELADEGYRIAGINFDDEMDKALGYLADDGNPFFATGFDPQSRVAVNWGVAAPPETFIIDGDGTVLLRFQGPIHGVMDTIIRPALAEAEGD